jgi:hypothetical protein
LIQSSDSFCSPNTSVRRQASKTDLRAEADEQVSGRSSHELLRHSPLEPEIPALDKMTSRRAQAAGHSGISVLHGSGKVTQTYVIRPKLAIWLEIGP